MFLDLESVLGEVLGYKTRIVGKGYRVLKVFYLTDIDEVSQFRKYFEYANFNIVECEKGENANEEWYDVLIELNKNKFKKSVDN